MIIPLEIQAARIQILRSHPYLTSAVWAMQPVPTPGLETMAVDQYYRMYFDPAVVTQWSVEELATVIQHEVAHLMRLHFIRMKGCEPDLANIATDAEINDDLASSGLKFPLEPVMPASFGQPNGLLAEEYYAALLAKHQQQAGNKNGSGGSSGNSDKADNKNGNGDSGGKAGKGGVPSPGAGRCGSCATGTIEPWEHGAPDETGVHGVTHAQAELIRRDVANQIRNGPPGSIAGHWKRWADEVLSPKVNWRQELATAVRQAVANVAGGVDYSYHRPSRRQSTAGKIILPTMRQPVPEVAIIIDTSGSIGDDMISQSLGEVSGILKACGLRHGVTVLAVDSQVQTSKRVFDARQVKLSGGGGTDMGIGIIAATKLSPRPQIAIVLTDGYTPWPKSMPRGLKRVIVCLLGANAPDGPAWSKRIRIE